jgi:hypothetical protein
MSTCHNKYITIIKTFNFSKCFFNPKKDYIFEMLNE